MFINHYSGNISNKGLMQDSFYAIKERGYRS